MGKIYIHREIEKSLNSYVKQFAVTALTGPRQSGKSTLLRKLFKTYTYMSLDDPVLKNQAITDPELFLDNAGENSIIDEIQYCPELLNYIKIRVDKNPLIKGRYILTGSQQFILMKNLDESLAGRIGILELLPFNTQEKKKISIQSFMVDFFWNKIML